MLMLRAGLVFWNQFKVNQFSTRPRWPSKDNNCRFGNLLQRFREDPALCPLESVSDSSNEKYTRCPEDTSRFMDTCRSQQGRGECHLPRDLVATFSYCLVGCCSLKRQLVQIERFIVEFSRIKRYNAEGFFLHREIVAVS